MRSLSSSLRVLCACLSVAFWLSMFSPVAYSQTSAQTNGSQVAAQIEAAKSGQAAAVLASPNGDFEKGATNASQQIDALLGSLIPAAVAASNGVMDEANKFAWGLSVITLVLVGVRFAGTHHPVSAWVNVFEELAIVGIFVALYLGYTVTANGFWTWFQQLAAHISDAKNGTTGAAMARLSGVIFDALKAKGQSVKLWDLPAIAADCIVLLFAAVAMCLASIVFVYYSAVGQIQAAIGIVLGPIALALGFSSYTRNYFVKWLDWMISAGMYVVIVSILIRLVGTSIISAVEKATSVGGSTTLNAAYVFNLSVFILLLSFEIPKLATIFGGGATASGTSALKLARNFLP